MSNLTKNIISGSFWGIIAKILDALFKFITIPLLVAFYGKAEYGLIVLAFSLNAYLRLMDMGLNIGSIRFFSIWISKNNTEKISDVSRSSMVFYGVVGVINALAFLWLAEYGGTFFDLNAVQLPLFKWIMYILSFSSVFNWVSSVITQLLTAHGELGWVNKVIVFRSLLYFSAAVISVSAKFTLVEFFFLHTLAILIPLPINIYKLRVYRMSFKSLLFPKWNGMAFKEVLGYSISIFIMGLFQFSADNLRPILIGIFASKGIEALTEYKVLQTIVMLVVAFGGVFMQAILPSASKIYVEKDNTKLKKLIYDGTRYISVFLSFTVFLLILNSKTLLQLYMGGGYVALSGWLVIWLLTILFSMHNAPVASMVLSTGKTKFLVYSSSIACVLSLPVTALLASSLNVGSAVIGYLVYILLQISFYYFYYIPKVLKLNGSKIFFYSFIPSVLVGFFSYLIAHFLVNNLISIQKDIISLITCSVVFLLIYSIVTLFFILKPAEIKKVKRHVFAAS